MTCDEIVQIFLQTSVVLAVASVVAIPVLRICRHPGIHQLVWGGVLLLGLVGMRIPVVLPVAPSVAEPVEVVEEPENPMPEILVEPEETFFAMNAEPFSFEPAPLVATIALEPPIIAPAIMEPETIVSEPPREQRSLATVLLACWAAGVFVQVLRHFVRYVRLSRMLRHAEPDDEPTLALWTEILDRAGVEKRRPKLVMLSDIGPAMIRTPFGYTLLLSQSHWNELDTELRRGVMRHELAHFLYGDLWKTSFARLVALLHWFNPLAHLAARRFEEAVEWSADSFSYGSEKNGLEQFAAAMLSLHETTPRNYCYRVAFGSKNILRRLEFLKRMKTAPKESAWKTGLVLGLSLTLFVFGSVNIRITAQEKKANIVTPGEAGVTETVTETKTISPKIPEEPKRTLPSFPDSIYDNGPHRGKLNDMQIVYVIWDEAEFKQYYATAFCPIDKPDAETEWISTLKGREPLQRRGETKFYRAINGLARLKSKAAIPELTRIATERIHKDNSYRHNSVKALGWIGDPKVVPELIPLLYFLNFNCRLETQVSLVRLTGVNFGYDWKAWGNWWNENRRKFGADMPEFDMKLVDWVNVGYIWYVTDDLKRHFDPKIDPRLLALADPEVQKIQDRSFLLAQEMQLDFQERKKTLDDELEKAIQTKLIGKVRKIEDIHEAEFPKIVSTNPPMGAVDVDPSLTELSVTFDRPMAEGMAWYTKDDNKTFPERTSPEFPVWSEDRRTCTMQDVVLKPGKTYNIWFNTEEELHSSIPGDGFRSNKNVPLRPVLFTFTTSKNGKPKAEDAAKEQKAREYFTLARGALALEIVVLERSIGDLDNAIRLKPDFVDAYLERATKRHVLCVQYSLDNRFDGKDHDERRKKEIEALRPALADCDEAIRLAPDNAKAYSVRAGIHIAMGNSESKFDDETKAIELDPLPEYYAGRASTFAVVRYDTAAYADFMEAKKRIGDRAGGLAFHDKTWNEVIGRFGDKMKAENACREFMERKVDYARAYRHLLRAETLYRQALPVPRPRDFMNRDRKEFRKLLEQALAECNAAIEIDPNFEGFWNQRGRVHAELDNIDDAIRDHTEGIRLRPDRGDYWARANLYGKKGDLPRQLADLDKEIDIRKPDDPWLDSIKSNREQVRKKLDDM